MRHVIDAIAAQGRGNDSELLHVTKKELAGLDAFKRKHTGTGLPRNPKTGLHEAGWFEQYVEPALPAVAGLAAGALTGGTMAAPVAAGVGAATGAGLKASHGANTQDVLMSGVMGGIAGYGAGSLGAGLAGAEGAATTGVTQGVTPIGEAGTNIAAAGAETGATSSAPTIAEAGGNLSQLSGQGQMQSQAAMNAMPNLSQGQTAVGANMPGATVAPTTPTPSGVNWDYATSKPAFSDATRIGTGTLGLYSMAPQDQTETTGTTVNKTLPKAEIYYTPYGERRTRIAAAEGGLMGFNGAYGDYDGAEDGGAVRRYAGGGGIDMVRQMQPGGAWGNLTADAYGVMHENMPGFINDATPGGFLGATTPGKADYLDKKAAEEQKKKSEQEAGIAAALKARQDQESSDYWKQRYGMAGGGPVTNDSTVYINTTPPPQVVTPSSPEAYARAFDDLGGLVGLSVIRKRAGNSDGMAGGGIANIAAAKGRYLQGPGGGLDDEIPARIDGKQEARLASGEYVISSDVVSALGGGSSEEGARKLHDMMDRIRMEAHGTKQQVKRVNPKKVLPA